ncbi:MAG: hypothetical protein ACO3LE_07640 [Bdellovibrionota bacterium]
MIDKLMKEAQALQYEILYNIFFFGLCSVAILTVLAFVLPSIVDRKNKKKI